MKPGFSLPLCALLMVACTVAPRPAAASEQPAATTAGDVAPVAPASPLLAKLLSVGMLLGVIGLAQQRTTPLDPVTESESPGIEVERKKYGKYHGLDPWDAPALFVSEPGTGLVFDVRELPQTRPGFVRSPVTGNEFEIGPNVVASAAGKGGALREPAFKDGRATADTDSDATGTKE